MKLPLGTSDFLRRVAKTVRISVINRFFEQDPTNQDDQVALLSRPGLQRWLPVGDGPIRAIYSQPGAFNEALFVASGNTLYKIDQDETLTTIGTLSTDFGYVSMAATDVTLFIADGTGLKYYTENSYARGTLTASGVANNDVVVVGTMYYKFTTGDVDAGTPLGTSANPWLVAVAGDTEHSLNNLGFAISNLGLGGSDYSTALIANEDAAFTSSDATTLVIRAREPGADGNSIVTTETGANLSWGAGTLATGGSSTFADIVVPDDHGIKSVGVIIGFCICVATDNEGVNGRFYWVRPAEITIDPLDFATAERSPDPVWNVVVVGDQFWLPGLSTTEVWAPTGDGDAPFQRIPGRLFDKGVWEGTVIQVKDSVMAVGTDGTVYKITSQPEIVSNVGISQRIREAINAKRASLEGGSGLTPTVSIDFKNGVYSIGGVSKTLDEVCEEFADYADYTNTDVVAGTGLSRELSTVGPVNSQSVPALTTEASAAVLANGVDAGFTAVITYSVALTGGGLAQIFCELIAEDISTGWGAEAMRASSATSPLLYDYDSISMSSALISDGQHKLAFTLAADRLAGSMDGGAVQVSSAPQANMATRIVIGGFAQILTSSSGPVSAVIESVNFYATQPDVDLVGLST